MNLLQSFVTWMIRRGTGVLCRIDENGLEVIPQEGPLILAVNHINSLEVPLLVAKLHPRRVIGLAKVETWDSWFMGLLFDLFEAIPIHRGTPDIDALKSCLATLSKEDILVVAPEGTRSYDGKLQCGQPGIALIALHSGATILPIVHWGGESFSKNLKSLKRTDFHIRVGKPFRLDTRGDKVNGKVRQKMADEIMSELAKLMPEQYRGHYHGLSAEPRRYLDFA